MLDFKKYDSIFTSYPTAFAVINGSEKYPDVFARINFYQHGDDIIVATWAKGLPINECGSGVFGFHIHSGESCTGNDTDPFSYALTHYNPKGCSHPYHSGDMPPLFGENGDAFSAFMTRRFNIDEIIGKTVIIHSMPDDFTTQPSGNSGEKIACGIIRKKDYHM